MALRAPETPTPHAAPALGEAEQTTFGALQESQMPAPPQPQKNRSGYYVLLLLAVMGGFILISAISERASNEVATLSKSIASTSSPSVERLARLRSLVFEVELNFSEYLRSDSKGDEERRAFETSLDSLDEAAKGYLALPLLHGEQPYWAETQAALIRFESSVRSSEELAKAGHLEAAEAEFSSIGRDAGDDLVRASLDGIQFHAQHVQTMATRIEDARRRSLLVTNGLSAVCVAFGVAGLFLVVRQDRRQRALMDAHSKFHEARAAEFEQFAGRVAHDIRGPLSIASMGTQLALREARDDGAKVLLARVARGLSRADAITTALLEFARSGAHPEPGARATPRELLDDFVRGVSTEAEPRGIELDLQPVAPVMVACGAGVYLSLVGNLVRNAIKYMGDSPTRRISLRVAEEGSMVRTEVIDTGPGIAAENLGSLFQAYFRAGGKEGLGLGLATVKKLVEGHGGAVGVTSEIGKGSTFWFTLHRAGSADAHDDGDEVFDEPVGPDDADRSEVRH
jgi:signal transduction histidine kinase